MRREEYQHYFKDKKVIVMGLGLLGRGIADARFLAECGAEVLVTDLKDEKVLKTSVDQLRKFSNITFILGEHRPEDFRNCDFVLKAAGVPLESPFLEEARKNRIPIEMDESLFAKIAQGVTLVGITGTRGKSTTTHLIFEMLKKKYEKKVFLAGNIRGKATLPLLSEVSPGDIIVLELSSWQLQGFHDAAVSPNVGVFTNFLDDHLNYYHGDRDLYFKDKAAIFRFQKKGDTCVVGAQVAPLLAEESLQGNLIVARKEDVPSSWKRVLPGEHNQENIACAIHVARTLEVSDKDIQEVVETFKGVEGRLQLVRESNGVAFYNDTTATTPDATFAGLKALGGKKPLVLIMGGTDKGLSFDQVLRAFPQYAQGVVLLPGTGTERIITHIQKLSFEKGVHQEDTLTGALNKAQTLLHGEKQGIILFSPGFASFGMFQNEFDRSDQFLALVETLN